MHNKVNQKRVFVGFIWETAKPNRGYASGTVHGNWRFFKKLAKTPMKCTGIIKL